MNVILDTSFVSALWNENDPHHAEAERLFFEPENSSALLPMIVVAELLSGGKDGQKIVLVCKGLCSAFLPETEKEIGKISEFPFDVRNKLKANDCLILAHAIIHSADLLTFDKNLKDAHLKLISK